MIFLGVAPSLPKLASESTPLLGGALNSAQISWIGSIGAIGVVFGSFFFGLITSIIGCKNATVFVSFPTVAFWILIYFGNLYYHILVAKFLSGMAFGGIQTTVVLYISEIANNKYSMRKIILQHIFTKNKAIFMTKHHFIVFEGDSTVFAQQSVMLEF